MSHRLIEGATDGVDLVALVVEHCFDGVRECALAVTEPCRPGGWVRVELRVRQIAERVYGVLRGSEVVEQLVACEVLDRAQLVDVGTVVGNIAVAAVSRSRVAR